MNPTKPITTRMAWLILLAVGILTRFPFLGWFTTETTDGILCVTYFQWRLFDLPRFVLFPGYPALLSLFRPLSTQGWGEIEMWGRALSAVFGLATLFPLWRLARRWASVEISFLVCLAYLFSPLSWMWSLRIMADTMFVFFFWYAVERLAAFEESPDGKKCASILASSLTAFLVRPEGALLLLFAAVLLARQQRYRVWAASAVGVAASMGFFTPLRTLFLNSTGTFREGAFEVASPLGNLLANFWVYLTQPAWVFTPVLFFLAVGGLFGIAGLHSQIGRFWRRRLLILLGLLLFLKMIPSNYQDRYLLLFLPAVCLLAAYKLETMEALWHARCPEMGVLFRRNVLAMVMLGSLVVFSVAVLVLQRDSFGDLRRSAAFLRDLPQDAVLYSDEQFKTAYLGGRPLRLWTPEVRGLEVGDFLLFHTFNTPRLSVLEETLRGYYDLECVRTDKSFVVPLLTDLMQEKQLQNRVGAVSRRFETQYFETKLFRVEKVLPLKKKGTR